MPITISKPAIQLDEAIQELVELQPEKCTIVHCRLKMSPGDLYRIWPNTFLLQDSGAKAMLTHAFNIALYPAWSFCTKADGMVLFTLVFEGLEKSCSSFTLQEIIPEAGGFSSGLIQRNKTDVYETDL